MKGLIRLAFLFALLSALSGCRDTKYITVPVHDTTYTVRDMHDSTYIDRWHTRTLNGDTVYVHDSIYESHVEWKHDTLKVVDEKPVEVPVVKEVEKELSWLQRTLVYIGIGAVVLLVLWVLWKVWLHRLLPTKLPTKKSN